MPYRNRGYYSNALIYSDGKILLVPDTHITAKCEGINLDDPWAEHTCELKYGSWTFDGHHIDLQLYNDKEFMDLDSFKSDSQIQVCSKQVV